MDTADDLALQQNQEEAQHSKYALLRPSVPWAVSAWCACSFWTPLAPRSRWAWPPPSRGARPGSQRRDSARRRSLSVHAAPAAAEHPAGGPHHQANGARRPRTPRPGAGISSTALSGVVYGCPSVQARQGPRNWYTAGVHDTAWPRPGTWHPRLSPSLGNWSEWRIRAIWRVLARSYKQLCARPISILIGARITYKNALIGRA